MLGAMTGLATDLAQRGAAVVGFGGDAAFRAACAVAVPGPELIEAFAPLGQIVAPQLSVESLARRLGLDPDAPRGLSKITQTDRSATQ